MEQEHLEDLDVEHDEAGRIVGGKPPATPPTPPGVPIPYPNVTDKPKR